MIDHHALFLIIPVAIYFIVVFSQAMECYFCGSRNVYYYWAFKTKGACAKCKLTRKL